MNALDFFYDINPFDAPDVGEVGSVLDGAQREAKRWHVIKGPPGTGKTTTLVAKFELEAQTYSPDRIALVTFTNAARDEAIRKLCESNPGLSSDDLRYVRTLDSISLGLTRADSTKLFTEKRQIEFRNANFPGIAPEIAKHYSSAIDRARVAGLTKQQMLTGLSPAVARRLDAGRLDRYYDAYEKYRQEHGLITFEDLRAIALKKQLHPDVDVLIVDECQDLNSTMSQLVDAWATQCRKVYVAGDDDQSIYGFAGADPQWLIERFREHQGEVLAQSHRVPSLVHALALKAIQGVPGRISTPYLPTPVQGRVLTGIRAPQLAKLLVGKTNLVLARDAWALLPIKKELDLAGVLYTESRPDAPLLALAAMTKNLREGGTVVGRVLNTLFERRALADDAPVRGRLAAVEGSQHYTLADLERLLGQHPVFTQIKAGTPSVLGKLTARETLLVTRRWTGAQNGQVILSTIHGAKGAEADVVAIVPDRSKTSYDAAAADPKVAADEARLLYVALTRTKDTLIWMYPMEPKNAFRAYTLPR